MHRVRIFYGENVKSSIFLLNKEELGELESELCGGLPYIKEFKSIRGKIITSETIWRFEKLKGAGNEK